MNTTVKWQTFKKNNVHKHYDFMNGNQLLTQGLLISNGANEDRTSVPSPVFITYILPTTDPAVLGRALWQGILNPL